MDSIISTVQAINLLTGEDETFTVEHTQEKVWTIRYANGFRLSTSSDQFTEVEAAFLIGGGSGGVGNEKRHEEVIIGHSPSAPTPANGQNGDGNEAGSCRIRPAKKYDPLIFNR